MDSPWSDSPWSDSPWLDGLVGPGGVQESRMSSANDHCINTPGLKQEKKEMATKGDKSGRLGLDCLYLHSRMLCLIPSSTTIMFNCEILLPPTKDVETALRMLA